MCSSILGVFNTAFGFLLKVCCNISGGYYIIALFVFTLIMQIVLFPLGIKQQKSSVKMAKVKPKEMLIREKYKGRTDRVTQQKMQMEIQELYQKEGTSMFGGCLPLLIQLPIILILWSVIKMPLTYTANANIDTVRQYEIATQILDGAVASIDESGLLATTQAPEAVSGTENSSETSAAALTEQQTNLQTLRKNYVALMQNFAGKDGVTDAGRYKAGYIGGDTYSENTNAEFSLTMFMVEDLRGTIIEDLKNNGVSADIISKNIPADRDFSKDIIDSLPNFMYLGGSETLLDTPINKGFSWLLLIPVLIFVSSVVSFTVTQKLSPMANANPNGAGGGFLLKWGLPVFSTYLAWATFPAAVGMYWFYRTLLQMAQTYILSRMYPVPVVSEAELEEYKRQLKAKKKKTITIEVDEDDTTYDHLAVRRGSDESSSGSGTDDSSGYEMLKADDDVSSKVEWAPLKEDDNDRSGSKDKEG